MPIRFLITPAHWGDCPQARGLIEGLQGVGHVIADAGYDADHLRNFIADDLGATAQIKQNPTRSGTKAIDWALYKERNLVERFFNQIKRFRRIEPLRVCGRLILVSYAAMTSFSRAA